MLIKASLVNVEIINGSKRHFTVGILSVYLQIRQLQYSLSFFFNVHSVFTEIENICDLFWNSEKGIS